MEVLINQAGEQKGPYSIDQLNSLLEAGEIDGSTLCWYDGGAGWVPLAQFPGFAAPSAQPIKKGRRSAAMAVGLALAILAGGVIAYRVKSSPAARESAALSSTPAAALTPPTTPVPQETPVALATDQKPKALESPKPAASPSSPLASGSATPPPAAPEPKPSPDPELARASAPPAPPAPAQDLEALLNKSDADLRAPSAETMAAYEKLLLTLQNSNIQDGYRQAQAFLSRVDFIEPEQKRVASIVLKIAAFRQQLQIDVPQIAEYQKTQAAEEESIAELGARSRELKAQYDAMPHTVTANGVAHTRIMQMEREFDAANAEIKEHQSRADQAKKQAEAAGSNYAAAFRREMIAFFDDLKAKNRFKEILALTNCYTTIMGQDPGMVSLAQDALENERAERESVRIVDAIMAKVTPLAAKGAYGEAIAELERSVALVAAKLRDERVKAFALDRLKSEHEHIATKLAGAEQQAADATASMQQQRAARFAAITSAIALDPWEAERMLGRLAGDEGNTDDVSALRARINSAKRERSGQALRQIHNQLDESQSYFEKISATFDADLRRGDTERLTASIRSTASRENFVRAVGLMKMAGAQIDALPTDDLDPIQRADLAGLKASTKSCLEVTAKMQ